MVDAVSLYAKNSAVDAFGNCALLNTEGGDTATNQITSSPVQRDGNGTDEEDTCTKNASNPSEDDSDERIDNKDESGMKRKRVDKRKDEHSSRKLSDEVATSSDTNAKRND
ncbi:unnamed protein product, partial [Anisakis simplex]|uniref:Uncharacterized protein n=1 Tax=Anisakis simplex TaxID=6269 RepID=A0A0M3JL53_ANISI